MKSTHNIGKTITALLLAVSLIFSLCSCGISASEVKEKAADVGGKVGKVAKESLSKTSEFLSDAQGKIVKVYGTARDGVIYAYNGAAELTSVGYKKASAKASKVIGDVSEYVASFNRQDPAPEDIYAQGDPDRPIKDLPSGYSFDEIDTVVIDDTFATEQFVSFYISSILDARGYEVFNGAVYYKGEIYGGLIFTDGEVFIDENGQKIRSCGFVQLIPEDYSGVKITDSMVQSGLIAVSSGSGGTNTDAFIVEEYAVFDDFSGIFNDVYFCLHQLDHYVLSVSLKENKPENYVSSIELYDFDNEKYINTTEEDEVERIYVEDNSIFEGAATTVNAIVDIEENSSDDVATVFVLDGNTLDMLMSKASSGVDSVKSFISNAVKNAKLGSNQFLSFDSDGKAHILGIENETDEARVTNGLITTLSSGLATAGAVASIVCVAHAGSFVITAIVITTGSSAIVYNVSNILEGTQDIYYGAKGSQKESENPALKLFMSVIPDEQTATLVYHIWGASNTILSYLMMPVSKALNIAKVKGLNTFQTTASVIRAAITAVAKVVATGVGAGVVANYVSKVVAKVSNNSNIGRLAGFGCCLVTGFLIYTGLDTVDRSLDISGLYPKPAVKVAFTKAVEEQSNHLLKENISYQQRGEDERLVNDIVDYAVEYLGIDKKPTIVVVYDSNAGYCGGYYPDADTLIINMRAEEHMSTRGLVDTIGHEMRHVWQHGPGLTEEMEYSLNNYILPTNDYFGYRLQLCEADAYNFGEEFANDLLGALAA